MEDDTRRCNGVGRLLMAVLMGGSVFGSACSHQQPVLSSNEHLKTVGIEQARLDIASCQETSAEEKPRYNPGKAAVNGLVCVGSMFGFYATAATVGDGVSEDEKFTCAELVDPGSEAEFREQVEACLREKGYRTVVWR